MRRTLLVTNDFPPRVGGIQSYVHELASRLAADRLTVLASDYPGSAQFDRDQPFAVVRYPSSMLLPTAGVKRMAADLIRSNRIDAVWFGAAAPLGLMTPYLRSVGIHKVVASTHGHEVGWSMLPGTRQMLRRIGSESDVVTFVSRYSRRRISVACGPNAALEALSPGVDATLFRPDSAARAQIRSRYGLGDAPTVVCVSRLVPRKGQDVLIAVWPTVVRSHPGARLLIVGGGSDETRIRKLAAGSVVSHLITLTGRVPYAELPAHYQAGDIFAMPCRTRGRGLDVEGLGIVFLEASACGLPVIAGASGGAPETVIDGETGLVVNGRSQSDLARALVRLLADPDLAARWGAAGRTWVRTQWTWAASAERLAALLD
ncbi:MAG: glycosyltransferase family 4 protein [Nakamurella sp.]